MEGLDMMDWMLAEAKKSPMKISHDFDTRFRVWVDQIIPSRIDAIRQCNGDVDYAMRMLRLTLEDGKRLQDRAAEEGGMIEYGMRIEAVLFTITASSETYLNEVKR